MQQVMPKAPITMDRALAAMLSLTRWTAFPLNHDSKMNLSYLSFPEWQRLTNTENWYQEWGCCCNKPDCAVHGSLKLTCGKKCGKEFKSASQEVLKCCQQSLIGSIVWKNRMSLDMQTVETHEILREKKIKGIELQVQFMLHSGKNLAIFYILINLSEIEFKIY